MIDPEQIAKARKGDLPSLLQNLGIQLRREGQGFSAASHDSLKLFRRDDVWLYKWWARDGEVGDGIQFLRRHHGMRFSEAIEALSGTASISSTSIRRNDQKRDASTISWRIRAEKLVRYAGHQILTSTGVGALSFLTHERGLTETTIQSQCLGWLPEKDRMPSKIVIPCRNSRNQLIRVRFRIDDPEQDENRYRMMKGSLGHSPFPLGVSPGRPVIWVESELDGILLHQEIGGQAGVLALGSAAVRLSCKMIDFLIQRIPLNLICLDNDDCGKQRTQELIHLLLNAVAWPVPES